MQTILPNTFAVFNDDPAWHPNFTERKFCLLWRRSGFMNPLVTEPYPLPEGAYITLEHNEYSQIPVQVFIGSTESKWWHTGMSVCFHGTETERAPAPVIDFQHRNLLPLNFNLTAMNDDDGWCMIRQVDQRRARAKVEDSSLAARVHMLPPIVLSRMPQAPQPQPQPQPTQTQQVQALPKYVLEAFVRDAQAQEQTCPITCKTPKDCDAVVVTNCFHWFEAAALNTWRGTKNTCPVCKREIESATEVKV